MTIPFDQIPTTTRTPLVYAEFDGASASQGPTIQAYKQLIVGLKTSGGSQALEIPIRVTSVSQAESLFGSGSMLHGMAEALFANNTTTEAWFVAVADPTGASSIGSLQFGGSPTTAGTVSLYIGGRRVNIAAGVGDTADELATALAAAITADTSLPITAVVNGVNTDTVDFTAKHTGTLGDKIDIRMNYNTGEETPAGVTTTITAMSSGSGTPDLATLWSSVGEIQYHILAWPWTDSASLVTLETELDRRWTALVAIEGQAITAEDDTVGALGVLGDSRNSKHVTIDGIYKSPTPVWERAAEVVGIVSFYGQSDPGRPFQTLSRAWSKAPATVDVFTREERNLLLFDGIATSTVDSGGSLRIERLITTYKTDAFSSPDTTYLDLNTLLTLSFLRFDFKAYISTKYPRHKLGDDGKRYGAGQPIMTPNLMKAEAVNKFLQWEEMALVEGLAQFKNDLIVERNGIDPNRIDVLLPTDLINQLRVVGVKFGFLV